MVLALYAAGIVAGLAALVVLRRRRARRTLPLPPGPKPLPIIGNLRDLPREKEWLTYRAWNDQYGDVVCVDALGQKIIILGTAAAVDDLMEKRGAIYSDRPTMPMMQLMETDWTVAVLRYGDSWRRKRKLLHAHVHQGAAERYHPIQIASARRFARDILVADTEPHVLPRAVRLNFAQMILKATYGIDVESYESEYISLPEKVLANIGDASTPGRFFVNVLPILRFVPAWFPGASFQSLVSEHRAMQRLMLDNPINIVQSQMAEGTAPPSMARTMIEESPALLPQQSRLEMIKDVAGVAYIAGSDTTVAAVISFFLAMLIHPNVQTKAQAEVDRIVGKDRLPELEDRKELPYTEGVVNECLRWLPVLPMGVPHQAMEEDEYKGLLIPKGAIIFGSAWNILHNAKDYPEPELFNPERYLTPEGHFNPLVRDPRTACFGFGRRICPGRFIADTSLFLTVATLLATVDIVRTKDEQGKEIIPRVDVTSGTISHPKPFPWAVRPRSRHAEGLLAATSLHSK